MIIDPSLDPIEALLHMERYVNRGSPSGFTDKHTTSAGTWARGDAKGFYLSAVQLPGSIEIRDCGEPPRFLGQRDMLVHPDMIDDPLFATSTHVDRRALFVAPTANNRTVKVLDQDGWFIKLCYKGIIGRNDRQLASQHAISAVEVSNVITSAFDEKRLPADLYFLRETFARVVDLPDNDKTYEWGVVLREPSAYPHDPNTVFLLPAFSLFSIDAKTPEDPLILQCHGAG